MAANNTNQLQLLDRIEEDLAESLTAAGQALKEMGKDKSNAKAIETLTNVFTSRLDQATTDLSSQIAFLTRVTTMNVAESSSYGCRQDSKMAKSRLDHARTRLRGLESRANQ